MRSTILAFLFTFALTQMSLAAPQTAATPLEIDGVAIDRLVASHPLSDPLLVAGGAMLYKYHHGMWHPQSSSSLETQSLVHGGGQSQIMLAGDKQPCAQGGSGGPLQVSADNGVTWREIADTEGLFPLAIWPDSGVALAISCLGPLLSADAGKHWTPVPGIDPGYTVTAYGEIVDPTGATTQVLLGLTGEGGTSSLYHLDLMDPSNPVVTPDLRTYYGIGALTGYGDTWLLGAMDGLWVSTDAGATWTRHAEGIEDHVLAEDPAEAGLPEGVDPREKGVRAVSPLPDGAGFVVGLNDGLYTTTALGSPFTKIELTVGPVDQIQVSGETGTVVYQVGNAVYMSSVPVTPGS